MSEPPEDPFVYTSESKTLPPLSPEERRFPKWDVRGYLAGSTGILGILVCYFVFRIVPLLELTSLTISICIGIALLFLHLIFLLIALWKITQFLAQRHR